MTWKLKKKSIVEMNNMHKNGERKQVLHLFYCLVKIWKQNNDTRRESLMSFAAILASLKTFQSYRHAETPLGNCSIC